MPSAYVGVSLARRQNPMSLDKRTDSRSSQQTCITRSWIVQAPGSSLQARCDPGPAVTPGRCDRRADLAKQSDAASESQCCWVT